MNRAYDAVLVDVSVLVGASCPTDDVYNRCGPLFEYFSKRPVGIVTESIKENAKKIVSQKYGSDPVNLKLLEMNIGLLKTEEIDYKGLENKLLLTQQFYFYLPINVRKHIRQSKKEATMQIETLMKNVPKEYKETVREKIEEQVSKKFPASIKRVKSILSKKISNDTPCISNSIVLAEACQLKSKYPNIVLASTDFHMSPIRLTGGIVEPFISNLIEEEFGIYCEWPHIIYKK